MHVTKTHMYTNFTHQHTHDISENRLQHNDGEPMVSVVMGTEQYSISR